MSVEPWEYTDADQSYTWTDITQQFLADTNAHLTRGELLNTTQFTLLEAMSAIEVMDAKMDVGMQRQRIDELGYEHALKTNRIKDTAIAHAYTLATVDCSLAALCTWLEGDTLATTVFTNLYAMASSTQQTIHDSPMRAFMLSVLKLCALCRDIIEQAIVYDEEDYQSQTYGFDFANQYSVVEIMHLCAVAVEELTTIEPATIECKALIVRLQFMQTFIGVLCKLYCVNEKILNGEKNDGKAGKKSPVKKSAKSLAPELVDGDRMLTTCLEQLDAIIATLNLAQDYHKIIPADNSDFVDNFAHLPCFEPDLHRRLLPPTFPRVTRMYSPTYAIHYLKNVCTRLQLVCVTLPQLVDSFDSALFFTRDFSRNGSRLLERSLLQLIYLPLVPAQTIVDDLVCECSESATTVAAGLPPQHSPECPCFTVPLACGARILGGSAYQFGINHLCSGGSTTLVDGVLESIRRFIYTPELAVGSPILSTPVITYWLSESSRVLLQLITHTGRNRSRQRDCMATEIFGALDGFMNMTENLPMSTDQLRQLSDVLARYVLHHTLYCMHEWFESGFELQLYAPHEMQYVYWYMADVVYRWLRNIIGQAIESSLNEIRKIEQASDKSSRRKSKHRRDLDRLKTIYVRHEQPMYWQAMHQASMGMYWMMLALTTVGYERTPRVDDTSLRYAHRLSALRNVHTPQYIHFEQYIRASKQHEVSACAPATLFDQASVMFTDCRHVLANLATFPVYEQQASKLDDICKHNTVVCRLLASNKIANSEKQITYDYSTHTIFPKVRVA